jgi:hypothetical protein
VVPALRLAGGVAEGEDLVLGQRRCLHGGRPADGVARQDTLK